MPAWGGGAENQLGLLAPALGQDLLRHLACLGADDYLVDVRKLHDPSGPAPSAVLDLVRENPHAPLWIRPGAVLGVDNRLGHRRRHRRPALVVVLALWNLADEAVVWRLRRDAGDVYIMAVDEDPCERSGPFVGGANSLVLEQQVCDSAQEPALGIG